MKQATTTNDAPGAPFLSQAVTTGGCDTIYVSGQIHALPDNTLVGDTTEEKVAHHMNTGHDFEGDGRQQLLAVIKKELA